MTKNRTAVLSRSSLSSPSVSSENLQATGGSPVPSSRSSSALSLRPSLTEWDYVSVETASAELALLITSVNYHHRALFFKHYMFPEKKGPEDRLIFYRLVLERGMNRAHWAYKNPFDQERMQKYVSFNVYLSFLSLLVACSLLILMMRGDKQLSSV